MRFCCIFLLFYINLCRSEPCPQGWSTMDSNRTCFRLFKEKKTWQDASDYCRTLKNESYIASVVSRNEMEGLLKAAKDAGDGTQRVWIGLFYDKTLKTPKWRWSDNEPWDESGYGAAGPWAPSQPDNLGLENCGVAWLIVGGKFMDFVCDFTEAFACKIYQWSTWAEWGECSKSCFSGTRLRTRTCTSTGRCPGVATETTGCNERPCPFWADWSSWGACTVTCGGGRRTRSRECRNAPGCEGDSAQVEQCAKTGCPIWSVWSYWDSCTATCGGGVQKRVRTCGSELGGCIGNGTHERACNSQECREPPCPEGFLKLGYSCYKLKNVTSWVGANDQCDVDNAALVSNLTPNKMCLIQSAAEQLQLGNQTGFWTAANYLSNHTLSSGNATNSSSESRAMLFTLDGSVLNVFATPINSTNRVFCEIERENASGCFRGWLGFQSQCYRLFESAPVSFAKAEDACSERGGHLVSVNSSAQLSFLSTVLKSAKVWIGLSDLEHDYYYEWTDASSVYDFLRLPGVNLSAPSLNTSSRTERCMTAAIMSGKLVLDPSECDKPLAYLCRVSSSTYRDVECNGTSIASIRAQAESFAHDRPTCPATWKLLKHKVCSCWTIVTTPLAYVEAKQYCQANSADLLIVFNDNDKFDLQEMLLMGGLQAVWIGYNNMDNQGFRAVDGSETSVNNVYAHGEPFDVADQLCVYVDGQTYRWHSDWCVNRRPFVCRTDVACVAPTAPPVFPTLGEVEKVVAAVVTTLGNTVVIAILASLIVMFAVLKNFCLERCIMMSEEISLLVANILIVSLRDNYGNAIACQFVAVCVHYMYLVHFTCLCLEACQSYAIVTGVIASGGIIKRWQNMVVAWVGSLGIVLLIAGFLHDEYVTPVMCILHMGGGAMMAVVAPNLFLIVIALIIVEATGMGEDLYPRVPGFNTTQMTTNKISQRGLLIIIPLSATVWLCTLIAISAQNIGLYTVVFGINIALSVAILIFHGLSNPQARFLFVKMYRRFKKCLCMKQKIEDGSFEADYKDHDYNLWKN